MKVKLIKSTTIENAPTYVKLYIDRAFVKIGTHTIVLATPTECARYIDGDTFTRMQMYCNIDEIDIKDYRYFKNHLSKIVKKELEKENN